MMSFNFHMHFLYETVMEYTTRANITSPYMGSVPINACVNRIFIDYFEFESKFVHSLRAHQKMCSIPFSHLFNFVEIDTYHLCCISPKIQHKNVWRNDFIKNSGRFIGMNFVINFIPFDLIRMVYRYARMSQSLLCCTLRI